MIELYLIGGFAAVLTVTAARSALKVTWRKLFRAKVKGHFGESKVNRALKKFTRKGGRIKKDILIEHGRGTSQIDHLLITKQGILVLETKNYSGVISGTASSRNWSQSFPGSFKEPRQFYNPLLQNEGHIRALRSILKDYKDIPMHSLVVFSGNCTFPELPGVVSVHALPGAVNLICSGKVVLTDDQIKDIEHIIEGNLILGRSVRSKHSYEAGLNASAAPGEIQQLINDSIKNSVHISTKPNTPYIGPSQSDSKKSLFMDTHAQLKIRGRTDTIDGFFEAAKRRADGQPPLPGGNFDYFICPYTRDQFPASEAMSFYQGLWISYLKTKPELVEYMKENGTENLGNNFKCKKTLALYNSDKEGFTDQVRSSPWYRNMVDKQNSKRPIDDQVRSASCRYAAQQSQDSGPDKNISYCR